MVHRRKILTTEVMGNKRFFIVKVVSDFNFNHFLEKWLQHHLVEVLSEQKFSSRPTQYSGIRYDLESRSARLLLYAQKQTTNRIFWVISGVFP